MVNRTLARRYAVAVDSLARERGISQRIASDLSAIAQAIGDRGGLAYEFFASPVVSRPDKERLLTEVFGAHVDPVSLHTLLLLVRKRRESLLGAIVSEYLALQRAARGAEKLVVTSARELDPAESGALIERLERVYGKKFEVTEQVDPTIIGGLCLMVGDRRIDASIAGRLDSLARELTTVA